jgi:isoleucyl-tRNA synthetase
MQDKKLRLPKTDFPMQANLSSLEPRIHQYWKDIDLYNLLHKQKLKKFTCHFGPPFANGDPHCGHGLSYTIKSISLALKTMEGFSVFNVFGWDCHGLPIELKVKDMKITDKREFYMECQKVAKHWIGVQKPVLEKLCFLHDPNHHYSTINSLPSIYQSFSNLLLQNRVFLSNRPLIWSTQFKCNIPAIDIEYENKKSQAIYILFPLHNRPNQYALIYTTTPWSLIDNMAICINKNLQYSFVMYDNKEMLIQTDCIPVLEQKLQTTFTILNSITGTDLLDFQYDNFIHNKIMPFIHGNHVSADGTGLVHTAPAHGIDDFEAFYAVYDTPILDDVTEDGYIEINYEKISVFDTPNILKHFEKHLLFSEDIVHSYPFYKGKPLIYKTSEQIYLRIDDLKSKIVAELHKIQTAPESLKNDMILSIEGRDNWCLSRNRIYGTPLALFIHKANKTLLINETVQNKIIEQMCVDPTYFLNAECINILQGFVQNPSEYRPYLGVLDCWYESACVSSIILPEYGQNNVADLYSEGKDQKRGWFNSSAFLSMSLRNQLPYKTLIANGFVVDDNGDKLSKSKGNAMPFTQIIEQYGLDVFTILVASANFKDDVKIGPRMLTLASEQYRKFRNVLRYLISVVEYKDHIEQVEITEELEKAILGKLRHIIITYKKYTSKFEIHLAFNLIKEFVIYVSEIYFNGRKDCLYSDGNTNRRAQVIYTNFVLLKGLLMLLCPFIPRTCEEIAIYLKKYLQVESIFLFNLNEFAEHLINYDKEAEKLDHTVNNILPWINAEIDGMKKDKTIKKNEEVCVYTKDYNNMIKLLINCSEVIKSDHNEVQIIDKIACFRCNQRCGIEICNRCEIALNDTNNL